MIWCDLVHSKSRNLTKGAISRTSRARGLTGLHGPGLHSAGLNLSPRTHSPECGRGAGICRLSVLCICARNSRNHALWAQIYDLQHIPFDASCQYKDVHLECAILGQLHWAAAAAHAVVCLAWACAYGCIALCHHRSLGHPASRLAIL